MRIGFRTQRTGEERPERAPDNLYGPVPGMATSEGSLGDGAFRRSAYNWLELHSPLRVLSSLASGPPRLRGTPEPGLRSNGVEGTVAN